MQPVLCSSKRCLKYDVMYEMCKNPFVNSVVVSFVDDHEDEDAVVNRISWVKLISVHSFLEKCILEIRKSDKINEF